MATDKLTYKDFASDQEVRWCPGCGDYAILRAMQASLAEIGTPKEDVVMISGIGCSSRFPYYVDTYGFHTIHGRAPAIATGVKLSNPNLSVWQITGDGDGLAIGGNHLIHAVRRNIDINILLFNNEIYGLTKGQFSPTSATGLKTKSSPQGTVDRPFNPGTLVMGAGATFFARVVDVLPKEMTDIFVKCQNHRGTSFIEILQNCVIFNDHVFSGVTAKENKFNGQLWLKHGEPMLYGKDKEKGIMLKGLKLEAVTIGKNGITEADILVHDAHEEDATIHNMLINLKTPDFPVALGIIRQVEEQTFDTMIKNQVEQVRKASPYKNVNDLLNSGETWEIK